MYQILLIIRIVRKDAYGNKHAYIRYSWLFFEVLNYAQSYCHDDLYEHVANEKEDLVLNEE